MKPRNIAIIVLIVGFAAAVYFTLLREVEREEALLVSSLSGVVEVEGRLYSEGLADIVKTDRLVLFLLDPATRKPVALTILNPLVPPQVFQIGLQDSSSDAALEGPYLLVGITDKDGEIFKVTPGEVYGRSSQPIALGTEQVRLVLNEPFRGDLFNRGGIPSGAGAGSAGGVASASGAASPGGAVDPVRSTAMAAVDPALTISGTVRVAEALRAGVKTSDRMIILLMDPQARRPVASKIIPHMFLPQSFSISAPPGSAGKAYSLRIVSDKDGQPVNSVPGEVVGRSKGLIPLGTSGLDFVLDMPFRR